LQHPAAHGGRRSRSQPAAGGARAHPRLHRTLAIVVRRDKRLNRGLQRVIEALRGLTV